MSWEITGNTGTNSSANFLGTTDSEPLVIKTNAIERLHINTDGNIGIGTNQPDAMFDVRGQASVQGPLSINHAGMTGVGSPGDKRAAITFGATDTSAAFYFGAYDANSAKANAVFGVYSYQFGNWLQFWSPNGNVGIGSAMPQRRLQIGSDVNGIGFDPSDTSPNAGYIRFGDNTGWKLHFGRSRESSGGPTNAGTSGLLMTIQDNGNVGIGTTTPGIGTIGQGGTPFGNIVLDLVSSGRPVLGIKSTSASGQYATLVMSANNTSSKDIHWNLDSTGSLSLYQYSAAAETITFYNNGNVGIGTATPSSKLTVNGDVTVSGDVILTGADCAEEFNTVGTMNFEPGTVMIIDREGVLHQSQHAYDKRVAGVISGAGDYRPGMILDRKQTQDSRVPIALVGKVYCKVDAQYAPIEVGDLLTTSPTPGHAMKAIEPQLSFGCVIGKALRRLPNKQGLIPILVALQ